MGLQVLPVTIMRIPYSIVEALVWTNLTCAPCCLLACCAMCCQPSSDACACAASALSFCVVTACLTAFVCADWEINMVRPAPAQLSCSMDVAACLCAKCVLGPPGSPCKLPVLSSAATGSWGVQLFCLPHPGLPHPPVERQLLQVGLSSALSAGVQPRLPSLTASIGVAGVWAPSAET